MKPEWGTKRVCRKCAAHFYDLNKPEFTCPKCDANYIPSDFTLKSTRSNDLALKKDVRKKTSSAFPLEDPLENIDVVIDDDLEDEDLIEDTAELDDDDVHTVIKREEVD